MLQLLGETPLFVHFHSIYFHLRVAITQIHYQSAPAMHCDGFGGYTFASALQQILIFTFFHFALGCALAYDGAEDGGFLGEWGLAGQDFFIYLHLSCHIL